MQKLGKFVTVTVTSDENATATATGKLKPAKTYKLAGATRQAIANVPLKMVITPG